MRAITLFFLCLLSTLSVQASEKTDTDYPLGKIGGKYFAQEGLNVIRISELTAGGPGALAGLQVNDYISGAFGEPFEDAVYDTWGIFIGPTKGVGEAIEKAQKADGVLPLQVIRSGVGEMTVNVQLDSDGGLGPVFPLGNGAFESQYEIACAAIHESISNNGSSGVTGSGYPYRWAGFALLGHPDWDKITGDKPYRISINMVRDACLNKLEGALYVPQEQYLVDGSSNPNFVNQFAGHENWQLNTSLMFLAEYLQKTKETEYYDELQTYSEKIANRIQWWKQRGGIHPPAGGAHAGVHSDYNGIGFNICVVHSMSALAMARKVTDINGDKVLDSSVRIRDGRHFGYATEDEKPDGAKNVVPDGWNESVDPSIEEKMGWQWQQLKESMHPEGAVTYTHGVNERFTFEAGARSAASVFAYNTYLDGATPTTENQEYLDQMVDYMVRYQEHMQNAHTHTVSAVCFHALSMTYWKAQQRRYLLDQWKWYWHLAWQPEGDQESITGWIENDNDSNYLLGEIFTALPYSVARGGYELIPGWATDDLIVDFSAMDFEWFEPEYRTILPVDNEINFTLALNDTAGNLINSGSYTAAWTVVTGDASKVSFDNAAALSPTASFAADGLYELQLTVNSGGKTVTEKVRVHVHNQAVPSGYEAGKVVCEWHGNFTGSVVTSIAGTPSREQNIYCLDIPYQAEKMGRKIDFYIMPKETGNYQFYLASSNVAELHYDEGENNVWTPIASSSSSVERYAWDLAEGSVQMSLTAGQLYRFGLFDKTGYNTGYCSVGWKTPSNSTITLIDSSVLASKVEEEEEPSILSNIASYDRSIGSVTALYCYTSGPEPKLFQWYRNGEPVGPPTITNRLLMWPTNGGSHGEYYCVFTSGSSVLTSNTATVNVTNNSGSLDGGIWIDVFDELEGSSVEDLEAFYGFPWLTTGGYTTASSFYYKTPSQNTNYIGHRVTAWVVPPTSGNYRFYVTADDDADLYVSPTEYDAHMNLVAETTGATGERSWSNHRTGVSDYMWLEAGESYYIELRHKEKQGASYFGVAWQKEGDPEPVNGEGEIPSEYLKYRHGGYHSHGVIPAPVLRDDALNVLEMTPALIDVSQNDVFVGSYEVTSVSAPANGRVRISSDKKSLVYTQEVAGGETLSYTARQEDGQTGTATLELTDMAPITNDLIAYWPLDGIDPDNTLNDASGNGHSLVVVGDPVASSDAVLGSSLEMLNDRLVVPAGASDAIGNEMTFSLWAKRDGSVSLTDTTFFHAKDASGNRLLRINAPRYNAQVRFQMGNGTSTNSILHDLTTEDFDDIWVHWAFTKNSDTGEMRVYRNGELVVEATGATVPFDTAISEMTIGSETGGSNDFPGRIDEVRIHNRVLTQQEIQSFVYQQGSSTVKRWVDSYLDESIRDDSQKGGVAGDASGNGVPNGFYYAFGLGDPNTKELPVLDAAGLSAGLPVAKFDEEGRYTLSYVKPKEMASMSLTPMVSNDMQTWLPCSDPSASATLLMSELIDLGGEYEIQHLEFEKEDSASFFRFQLEE